MLHDSRIPIPSKPPVSKENTTKLITSLNTTKKKSICQQAYLQGFLEITNDTDPQLLLFTDGSRKTFSEITKNTPNQTTTTTTINSSAHDLHPQKSTTKTTIERKTNSESCININEINENSNVQPNILNNQTKQINETAVNNATYTEETNSEMVDLTSLASQRYLPQCASISPTSHLFKKYPEIKVTEYFSTIKTTPLQNLESQYSQYNMNVTQYEASQNNLLHQTITINNGTNLYVTNIYKETDVSLTTDMVEEIFNNQPNAQTGRKEGHQIICGDLNAHNTLWGSSSCKIKALRAKTNTYIKTPVRGEEPVFVVTGRKEDVAKAKREILSAAEHFSLIRATRKPSVDSNLSATVNSSIDGSNCNANSFGKAPPGPPSIPGQMTIQVRVPYRVVGLVVGPKGATIKHIQHQTQTYIVTPSREKEPIFEVTGLPDNVQSARKQIEAHIALRTGHMPPTGSNSNALAAPISSSNESLAVHSLNVLSQILNDPSIDSDLLVSLYKADTLRSAFDYADENCELSANKAGNMKGFDAQDNNKLNFKMGCQDSASVEKQSYMALLHSENPQLRDMRNTSHQTNEFVNCLSNSCNNLKQIKSDQESDLLTDVDHIHHVQQKQPLYPSSQPILSLSHQLQPVSSLSSLPPLQNHAPFVGNVGSYTQTLNFVNNAATVSYKSQNTTAAINNTSTGALPILRNGTHTSNGMARSCSSASSTASSKSANNSGGSGSSSRPELSNIWKNLGDSLDVDEGIGDSPNIWTLPTPLIPLTGSHCSPSTSISPTDSLLGEISAPHTSHQNNVGISNLINESHEPISKKKLLQQNHTKNGDAVQALVNSSAIQRRDCLVCNSKEITAVLVPCGHNMFCMECANRICELGDAVCPVCSLNVYHAMRILA
ncbi:uncharacterized protein LOC118745443 [Rhagoletis pomonella]|uniref:uncharacterized protein LOC118745443 n=1 Tax=Rhagoletis pomonella TaxID=28610 RepID=UPI0017864EDC|nr:uncharacterized protein LOC118745443 [Rhagoletis pomonella]